MISLLKTCLEGGTAKTVKGSGREYVVQVALILENHRCLFGWALERIEQPILCIIWFGPSWAKAATQEMIALELIALEL